MKHFILKARVGKFFKQKRSLCLKPPDALYFMGICGTAMAPMALYLKKEGFQIFGSDQNIYPPMSELLREKGILVSSYKTENIKDFFKLILIGNVISLDHPEIKAIQNMGIPCLSLPEFLEQTLISKTKNIVIAGTHGKSTSTALTSYVAEKVEKETGFFIGAVSKNFPVSFRTSEKSPYFVIEGDEYDTSFFLKQAKFLHYKPYALLLTGIEFDHADIYKNLDEIFKMFSRLVQKIPKEGCLVACIEYQNLNRIIKASKAPVSTYGLNKGDYTVSHVRLQKKGGQSFKIHYKKREIGNCFLPLFGNHNILNALGVFALSHQLTWPIEQVFEAFKTFKGLKKRLEFKGFSAQGARLYEDFAHHPRAISACLSALSSQYPKKKIIALFEASSFSSRLNLFQKNYVSSFQKADLILIAPPKNLHKISKEQRFSPEKLVLDLRKIQKKAFCYKSFTDIKQALSKEMNKNTVVVFMSSGSFGGLLKSIKPG